MRILRDHHFGSQFEYAVDVVVVNMADQQHIDRQRHVVGKTARFADLHDTRLQLRTVDLRRSAIDHHQAGCCRRSVMQK